MTQDPDGRTYTKRKRARQEAETRRRITEAVVELHRTVGPAATTVTAVADRAGVSRVTVYNHFPTEADLVEACSAHWIEGNPPPDPAEWTDVTVGRARVEGALAALYGYYRDRAQMLGNVVRDAPRMPSLAAVMDRRWRPYLEAVLEGLARGWPEPADPDGFVSALRLAADFHTWEVLTADGRDDVDAAVLATRMVEAARDGRA